MTVIHLMTSDQELIAVQSPKLASGDVNTVQIKVDFDDHWNNFSKTATFIKEGASNGYEVVFVNGYATVPHEVLDEDGNIFIGVRGTNGTNIKTSALVKYRVVKGAGSGEGSSTPTPTIYQQLLDAYASVESIAVDAKNTADNAKNTADNALPKSGGTLTGDVSIKTSYRPSLLFRDENGRETGKLYTEHGDGYGYMSFAVTPSDQMDAQKAREIYTLPIPSTGLTKSKWYEILTSKNLITIAQGGTGATSASDALSNLGGMPKSGGTFTGNVKANSTDRAITDGCLRDIAITDSTGNTLMKTNRIVMFRK